MVADRDPRLPAPTAIVIVLGRPGSEARSSPFARVSLAVCGIMLGGRKDRPASVLAKSSEEVL